MANTIISAHNPMDVATISGGQLLVQYAASAGIPNGILYLEVNPGDGIFQMVPQSQWETLGLDLSQPNLYLWVTFGTPPTSAAWGQYYVVGELLFYIKNLGLTINQLVHV